MTELIVPTRRRFLTTLAASLVTAPAIVRVASIMPVRALKSGAVIKEYYGSRCVITELDVLYGGRLTLHKEWVIEMFKDAEKFMTQWNDEFVKDAEFFQGSQWDE